MRKTTGELFLYVIKIWVDFVWLIKRFARCFGDIVLIVIRY